MESKRQRGHTHTRITSTSLSSSMATCTFMSTPSTSTRRHSEHEYIHRHCVPRKRASKVATTIPPANAAVANTTADIARSFCRVNVPCATPCSSFVASANISRGGRVLCGASRREKRAARGDFERQACPQRGGTCARAGKNA